MSEPLLSPEIWDHAESIHLELIDRLVKVRAVPGFVRGDYHVIAVDGVPLSEMPRAALERAIEALLLDREILAALNREYSSRIDEAARQATAQLADLQEKVARLHGAK